MKAAVYEGQEKIVVRDVPDPVLEAGEVLVKIEACCVCGSDRRTYRHGHASIPPPGRRLEGAESFDVDACVAVTDDGHHKEEIMRLTDGAGCSVVISACNSAQAQIDAVEIAARSGRIEFFGGLPKSDPTAALNTNLLHYKEITVTGSFSEKMSDFEAAVALIQSGRFPADKIVTHMLPLARMTEAFDLMDAGQCLKPCVDPRL